MPGKHKKHTPIVSEAQRGLFGARAGGAITKAPSLSIAEAKRHLRESKGKKLVKRKKRKGKNRTVGEALKGVYRPMKEYRRDIRRKEKGVIPLLTPKERKRSAI